MDTVWMVEEGEYSEYQVLAIFATKEKADEFSAHRPGSVAREWTLDTWSEDRAKFNVRFNLRGEITSIYEQAYIEDEPQSDNPQGTRFEKDELTITVHRGPRERAIKIASEYYTRIRAFLDEADERTRRAAYQKISDNYTFSDALDVATILAGIKQPHNPPRCGHDQNILKILGIPALPLVGSDEE